MSDLSAGLCLVESDSPDKQSTGLTNVGSELTKWVIAGCCYCSLFDVHIKCDT